jgi:hypothetical protein
MKTTDKEDEFLFAGFRETDFFFDATYFELKTAVFFAEESKFLFGGFIKWPFQLNDWFTWYPAYGIEFGNGFAMHNLGVEFDIAMAKRLFVRGTVGYRLVPGDASWKGIAEYGIPLQLIPISLGVGYAFK